MQRREAELRQSRKPPRSLGPPGHTRPRWLSPWPERTSVRTMPWLVSDLRSHMANVEREGEGHPRPDLVIDLKHHRCLRWLIIDECLNDQRTRQKKAMISRAHAGRMSETLFDHSHIVSQTDQSVCASSGCPHRLHRSCSPICYGRSDLTTLLSPRTRSRQRTCAVSCFYAVSHRPEHCFVTSTRPLD